MRRTMLLGMTALLALGWVTTAQGLMEGPREYQQLLADAEHYESQKIYVRAIESYKNALVYKPDSLEIETKIAQNYLALGEIQSFINRCNDINEKYGYPVSVSVQLADYYTENRQDKKAIEVLQKALAVHKDDEQLNERFDKLKYTYEDLYWTYEELYPFRNNSAIIKKDGQYGLISSTGGTYMSCQYDWLGALSNDRDVIPVKDGGEFYLVNTSGYRVEVPREGQNVEELGVFCNGMAPAKIGGKYGYIDKQFYEKSSFNWDGATVIQEGFGAVKQGEKWALISSSFEQISDYIYDDVKTDDYGYCSISGRAFVKTEQGYIMVDASGNRVGDGCFEDAVPFLTTEPAAVKKDGKWGFVDINGQMVIEPVYEEAKPFSNGLAPVLYGGSWGYIDQKGIMAIPADFTDAESFYNGIAPVKKGNQWSAIELNVK